MARLGEALRDAKAGIRSIRNASRRTDRALATIEDADLCGTLTFDAAPDTEEARELADLVELAVGDNPGALIEVIVVAHQGADKEEVHGREGSGAEEVSGRGATGGRLVNAEATA